MKFHEDTLKILKKNARVKTKPEWYGKRLSSEELAEAIKGVDAALIGADECTAKVFNVADKLKVLATVGHGYNNIDLEAATRKGVVVTNAPVMHDAVADFTLGLIICIMRKIVQADKCVKSGRWREGLSMSTDLCGKTLGIIGLGKIGSEVAKRAKCFKMHLQYYDVIRQESREKELGIKYVSLEELLKTSDVITIHTPLTPNTRGMIGEKEFSLMKSGAYLINTSRGEVVDEEALLKALKSGKLGGAALDVMAKEPPDPDNPLLTLDNIIITPHIATATPEARRKAELTAIEDVFRVLEGRKPIHILNPEVLKKLDLKD